MRLAQFTSRSMSSSGASLLGRLLFGGRALVGRLLSRKPHRGGPIIAPTTTSTISQSSVCSSSTIGRCSGLLRRCGSRTRSTVPSVRFALQRMHRRRGRRQAQVQGLTWPLRNRLLEAAGDRLIDIRDRAMLAVGYDTLLRCAELVSLEVTDLLEDIDGTATLLVRSGKTDPDGRGAMLYLARDHRADDQGLARPQRSRHGTALPFGPQGWYGRREARRQLGAAHLQADGPTGGASRRHRGHAGRAQHARRGGAGHDRLRHRAAGHPGVGALEERAHGAALRGAAAGAAQRRRAVGRAAAALRRTA